MEKKTIGQFIAVLRKANGLTQQELADRLNVSNKAVSRWERDESAPDITLIPALAEILGVTCDELLKGERITYAQQSEKKEVKVEKQVKSLILREISKYRTRMWITLALAVIGLIMAFVLADVSPEIPWIVFILAELVAFVMVTIFVAQMKDIKSDCELFENADAILIEKFDKCLGESSYRIYFFFAAILLTFLMYFLHMMNGGYAFVNHCIMFVALYWLCKDRYVAWVTGNKTEKNTSVMGNTKLGVMHIIQIGAMLLGVVVNIGAKVLEASPNDTSLWNVAFVLTGVLVAICIVTPLVFAVRNKESRKTFLFWGIRNILLIPSGYYVCEYVSTQWYVLELSGSYKEYSWWPTEVASALYWAICVITVFFLINRVIKKS